MTGGVSTWAHQLVTGLAEKQFVVYSVVANTSMAIRYEPPPNLAHMIQVPLWGTEDNAEFNPRPGWIARRMRRPGRHFELEFLPAYAQLVISVALGEGGPDDLVAALCALSIYADRYSLKRAMRDGRTWRLFRDTLAAHPLYQRLTTYEAIDLARSVYRYLAPLDYPAELPQVVHASAAAFCAIPAVVLRERWGVPFLLTEHGVYYRERLLALGRNRTNSPYRVFLSNFYAAVVAMAYSRADLVSPVARFNATWEMKLGVDEDKIHPMPNGVDPERFPLTRPAGSGNGPLDPGVGGPARAAEGHPHPAAGVRHRPGPHPRGHAADPRPGERRGLRPELLRAGRAAGPRLVLRVPGPDAPTWARPSTKGTSPSSPASRRDSPSPPSRR